jgi:hypothetical protein
MDRADQKQDSCAHSHISMLVLDATLQGTPEYPRLHRYKMLTGEISPNKVRNMLSCVCVSQIQRQEMIIRILEAEGHI